MLRRVSRMENEELFFVYTCCVLKLETLRSSRTVVLTYALGKVGFALFTSIW